MTATVRQTANVATPSDAAAQLTKARIARRQAERLDPLVEALGRAVAREGMRAVMRSTRPQTG